MSFPEPDAAADDRASADGVTTDDRPVTAAADTLGGGRSHDSAAASTGILGFTPRELVIGGAWLVGFVASFFPIAPTGDSIWTLGIHWILMMGVPTAAVFLVVLRRLSPDGIRRVGSLGIDQFASVAASVAAVSWAQMLWQQTEATVATGAVFISWVTIVGQLSMLVLVTATVFAPFLPTLSDDFRGRPQIRAHRNASPVRPVAARPRTHRERDEQREASAAPRIDTATTVAVADEPGPYTIADGASAPATADVPAPAAADVPAPAAVDVPAPAAVDVPTPAAGSLQAFGPEPGQEPASHEAAGDDAIADQAAQAEPVASDAHENDSEVHESEVLYNTAAVEALQDIFADSSTGAMGPVEHNTAPDGIAGDSDAALAASGVTEPPAADSAMTEPVLAEPFWILAPTERDVLDEHGRPLFRIGPTAWALAIEDRGGAFVVRHEDGRIGYLHDITDITKG